MHVLVTGGAGFIGSHLCDELISRDCEVWCIDNLHLGKEENIAHLKSNKQFHFKKLDILDRPTLNALFNEVKFNMVFHMAANSDIQQGSSNHEIDLKLTFLTTYVILETMLQHDVKKIFFASTSAVFGPTREKLHEEYGPLKPISAYGASKLAAESYISVFVDNYGFKAWIIRFPNVVGPRLTHGAIYDFMEKLKKDPSRLVVLGDGTQKKPYLYVKDLIKAIMVILEKAKEPLSIYHVSNEDLTEVREIAEIVIEEMGLKGIPIQYTGGEKGWVGDVPYFNYDISKIKSLNWTGQYKSTDAVRATVREILGKIEP